MLPWSRFPEPPFRTIVWALRLRAGGGLAPLLGLRRRVALRTTVPKARNYRSLGSFAPQRACALAGNQPGEAAEVPTPGPPPAQATPTASASAPAPPMARPVAATLDPRPPLAPAYASLVRKSAMALASPGIVYSRATTSTRNPSSRAVSAVTGPIAATAAPPVIAPSRA